VYGGNGMPMTTFSDNPFMCLLDGAAIQPVHQTSLSRPLPYLPYRARDATRATSFHYPHEVPGLRRRIKAHVFDRGTMPLALIVYDDF